MKLALVVPGGVDRSGECRVIPALLHLIKRLAQAHEVHVFALRQEAEPATWPLAGATVHNIGDGRQRWRAIRAITAEHRRAPFDRIQAIFSGRGGQVAAAAGLWLHCPILVHVAGGELVALRDIHYGGRLTWRGRLSEAIVLRCADQVTAASAPVIDALRALGIKAQRVPLGVDLTTWPPQSPRRRGPGPARLLHVASLNRVKDQPTLLRALAELVRRRIDFRMDIVGVDTLDGEIQRLATQLGLDNHVRFLGFRTQRELHPLMSAAHLLVMSSRHETGPLVLLEAAIAGVPTAGTAAGHLAEWSPAATLAVPPGDSATLADAIERLLNDEDLRLQLAWSAQRRAMREDADHTARAFEALYLSLHEAPVSSAGLR
ncbi:glycosyltransferase family 4 protein [Frateuria sp. GZRR35]|uniref:glycosyltransferase family 4 protein n=1 Tax=Frateuria sp. GZRR35 TaxID=3351536 RepID=UPI003EDC2F1A